MLAQMFLQLASLPPLGHTLQISIEWLYVVTSVIPLVLKGILPIGIIHIGKIRVENLVIE